MVKKTVMIVGGDQKIEDMFNEHPDFLVTDLVVLADIVCFKGGADVDPQLYGQKRHRTTGVSPASDKRDIQYWDEIKDDPNVLKVGICRGGQFLNVMNGGKMWQNVNNHALWGTHKAIDLTGIIGAPIGGGFGETTVTSTHHQMMRAGPDGEILCIAHEATSYEDDTDEINKPLEYDTEVVWYPKHRSLCFQPHPEYTSVETKDYFFKLLERVSNDQ
jgi:hypothetical protein